MTLPSAPNWLDVDLAAVAHNTRAVLAHTRQPLMAVVKANAYGLGAVEVGRTALQSGAVSLAVARTGDALALRRGGIDAPVLVFGMATADEIDAAIAADLTLTLYSFESAELLARRAAAAGRPVRVHLKVDTGFGRLGVVPEQALALAELARDRGGIAIDGVYSHLAMADETPDHPLTRAQIDRFTAVLAGLRTAGFDPRWAHLTNSAGVFGLPEAHFNLVRAGSA
ncbi:MAG TPA: alanine racemase, partial [Anaerolineaceae bacterium]|nr:alanine racemase [Anaerolineaceae bacterium]